MSKAKDGLYSSISTFDVSEQASKEAETSETDEEATATIEEALETTGLGRFNVWIAITAGLGLITINSETVSISYVIPTAGCDLNLSLTQKTILATACSGGFIITQYFWGYLSDRVGRKYVLFYAFLGGCVCTTASALVPSFWLVALFRFLNGTFTAATSGLIFVYIGEFFSTRYRSVALSMISIFVGLSMMLIPASAWLIIPNQYSSSWFGNMASWRIFLLMSGLPAIPTAIFLYFSPETPKYLAQAQRNKEVIELLHKIRSINRTKDTKIIKRITMDETNDHKIRIFELFNLKHLRNILLVCLLQNCSFGTCAGLMLWYPDFLKKVAKSTEAVTVCEAFNSPETLLSNSTFDVINHEVQKCELVLENSVYLQNILIGAAITVGYISMSGFIKFAGIKNLLVAYLGLAGVATVGLQFITAALVIDISFIILLGLTVICVVIVNAAVVEIFPTKMRGMALCLTTLSGRLGVIIYSSLVGYLLRWNCNVTFMLIAGFVITCSLLSLLLPLPGKDRRYHGQ